MQVVKPDEIESSRLQLVIGWYDRHSSGNDWPPVKAFMPESIPASALPHVGRADVELEPFRVFYRVLGSG